MRRAPVLIAAVVLLAVVVAGIVVGRRLGNGASTVTHAAHVTPAAFSPVTLRVLNVHGSQIMVSGYTGDHPHVLRNGESIEVSGLDIPAPWHVVITDPATAAVLYDKQVQAGPALLNVGPTSVDTGRFDARD